MASRSPLRWLHIPAFLLISSTAVSFAFGQGAKQTLPATPIRDADADHVKERNEWFFRGRLVRGKNSAELRRRAYQAKLKMRAQHAAALS